jgi:hypothetical protein
VQMEQRELERQELERQPARRLLQALLHSRSS